MIEDAELLRKYAQTGEQGAFAELVRRHAGLVYAVALRRLNSDRQLAEDVAQTVFRDFARKASSGGADANVAGWLFTSTRFAAAQAAREEMRRRVRETEAQRMNPESTNTPAPQSDLRPLLDSTLERLDAGDRAAVLLRFFENRPFAEIGAILGVSDDAAQKRVGRSLEKLRQFLSREGVTSTTAALALALAERVSPPVPDGVIARLTADIPGAPGASVGLGSAAVPLAVGLKIGVPIAAALLSALFAYLGAGAVLPTESQRPLTVNRVASAAGKPLAPMQAVANSGPSSGIEIARAAAMDPAWLDLFRADPELARAFLRMLGQSAPAQGFEVATALREKINLRFTEADVVGGWAEVAPEAAWAWAIDPARPRGESVLVKFWEGAARSGKIAMLARLAAELPAATRAEESEKVTSVMRAAMVWAEDEPEAALAWARTIGSGGLLQGDALQRNAVNGVLWGWVKKAPLEAVNWAVDNLAPGPTRGTGIGETVKYWGESRGLDEARAWLLQKPTSPDFDMAFTNLASAYLEKEQNIPVAVDLVLRASPGDTRDSAIFTIGSKVAAINPPVALHLLASSQNANLRVALLKRIAARWVTISPGAARTYLAEASFATPAERNAFADGLTGAAK